MYMPVYEKGEPRDERAMVFEVVLVSLVLAFLGPAPSVHGRDGAHARVPDPAGHCTSRR